MNEHAAEVEAGARFEFGKNWKRFLQSVNEERISQAEKSLTEMLELTDLRDTRALARTVREMERKDFKQFTLDRIMATWNQLAKKLAIGDRDGLQSTQP